MEYTMSMNQKAHTVPDEIVIEDYAPNKRKPARKKWAAEIKKMMDEIKEVKASSEERNAHYKSMAIEPLAVIEDWLTPEQQLGFLLGNVLKYIGRYNSTAEGKGGLRDLKKAQDYLRWAVESAPDQSTES